MKTKKIIGPPGTGKTTYLVNIVKQAIDGGLPPEKIAYLSFSRQAVREVVGRLKDRIDNNTIGFKNFSTLHAMAYRDLQVSKDDLMLDSNYREVARRAGLGYVGGQNSDLSEQNLLLTQSKDGMAGNTCYTLLQLARAREESIDTIWEKQMLYANTRVTWEQLQAFKYYLNQYKQENFKKDFTDLLDESKVKLDIDLVVVDEAQDLTRQQWRYVRHISQKASDMCVAGDDDQAIYEWAGADPHYFLQLPGDTCTLNHSHRIPMEVYNKAEYIAGHMKLRHKKQWGPSGRQGHIARIQTFNDPRLDFNSGTWLIMARHRQDIGSITMSLKEKGVIFNLGDAWQSNKTKLISAVCNFRKLQKGESIERKDMLQILKYTGDFKLPEKTTYVASDMDVKFPIHKGWFQAMQDMSRQDMLYIAQLIRNNTLEQSGSSVTVSTIHRAKGGEADNVILVTRWNGRVQHAMSTCPDVHDAEARVWYVAVTRAKRALFLLNGEVGHNCKFC